MQHSLGIVLNRPTMVSVNNSSPSLLADLRVSSHFALLYVRKMNWVNSYKDYVMMTPWVNSYKDYVMMTP